MKIGKIPLSFILEFILFLIIFFFAIRPIENFDFWFHVKYGEYILQTNTLPFTDQFSHTAFGQSAIPYEWLFQVAIYLIHKTFGNWGVQSLIIFFALTYTFLFRQILFEIFKLSLIPRMFLIGFSFVIAYDFWVERPQIVAYTIFMAVLYLILKRVFLGKNLLILTIPLFFIWTNLHASMILGMYLFFSFALVAFFKKDYKLVKDLIIFGLINTAVTLLPPIGHKTYQLLYLFFEKREFITLVISEWVPLNKLGIRFHLYLIVMSFAAFGLIWLAWFALIKKESAFKNIFLYFLPFIPLGLFVISGVRQSQFTMPVIILSTVPAIKFLSQKIKFQKLIFPILVIVIYFLTIYFLYLYRNEATGLLRHYPKQAIPFIKENLNGNMFNNYEMGGYLMYYLGPEIKVFIDGRTDMFLPKVLPEYDELLNQRYTDEQFKAKFDFLVDEYHISYAVITVERYTPIRRLARLLREDPSWSLIFFDDTTEIYVRNDGKNTQVIKDYSFQAATPFGKYLYKENLREKARAEYQRMNQLAQSSVSLNALGFMMLEEKKFDESRQLFVKALEIYPYAAAPKMNLAELSLKYGDINHAIELYKQAIKDEPERGLAYLRLGQLIIQAGGSKSEAEEIWQKGLRSTPDENILKQLKVELAK